ncbi:MAG: hypothetical protein ACM65K_24755 [Microcoleus sp.]
MSTAKRRYFVLLRNSQGRGGERERGEGERGRGGEGERGREGERGGEGERGRKGERGGERVFSSITGDPPPWKALKRTN